MRRYRSLGDIPFDRSRSGPIVLRADHRDHRCLLEVRGAGLPADDQILLRMAIEVAPVISSGGDIYGYGINVAMRILTIAGPNEIVASAAARERLTDVLDADIEDLGFRYVFAGLVSFPGDPGIPLPV